MSTHRNIVPLIHIGLPKTATKTLQWRLFAKHSGVFYLGRFDGAPFGEKYRQFRACRDEAVFRIMDEIAYSNFQSPDLAGCAAAIQQYLDEQNTGHKIPVWSWESYSTDSREHRALRASNLKSIFGEAKILVTIRHPLRLLESAYLQQLKRDNIGAGYKRGNPPFFQPVDEWIRDDTAGDITNHLDYPQTIKMYMEQFGRENIKVMVFEDLLRNSEEFYKSLCAYMGVDTTEALKLVRGNVDNSRWTGVQLSRLSSIANSRISSLRFRFADRSHRRKLLGLSNTGIPLSSDEKATARISSALGEQLQRRSQQGNAWLEEVFGLDLKGYGYY